MNKKEKLTKEVEKFFKKHQISGIIRLPGAGTYSLFGNDEDTLLILEHAKVELVAREKYINIEANKLLGINNHKVNSIQKEVPGYLG